MHARRTEVVLEQDGTLTLSNLPFQVGEAVEVIILTQEPETLQSSESRYSLRGTPIHYDKPTEPVAQDDWDALREAGKL